MNRKIILASTSPRRVELLEKLGIKFTAAAPKYEEDMTLKLPPKQLALVLSRGKAQSVAKEYPNAIIVSGDTFVVFRNHILGKPGTAAKARQMLRMLSGRQHLIISAFTIWDTKSGKVVSWVDEVKVFFRKLQDLEITNYIKTGEPLDRAGAYAGQDLGSLFVSKIEGNFYTMVGLPIHLVAEELKKFGIRIL